MNEARPTHRLRSFGQYLNKVFHVREPAATLTDSRHEPEISPQAVFLSVFHGLVFRLPSWKQLEADLAEANLQQWAGAPRAFKDDVLRYSLCGFDLEPLEQMLVDVNRRLKRNKAFEAGRVQGRIVAALDGIEVQSSYSRCCDSCLQRQVVSKDAQGRAVEQTQYDHRAVGCQIISSPVKPFLGIEWVRPGRALAGGLPAGAAAPPGPALLPYLNSPIIAAQFEGLDASATARELKARGVLVPARHQYLHVSPHFYNNESDLERLETELAGLGL